MGFGITNGMLLLSRGVHNAGHCTRSLAFTAVSLILHGLGDSEAECNGGYG